MIAWAIAHTNNTYFDRHKHTKGKVIYIAI